MTRTSDLHFVLIQQITDNSIRDGRGLIEKRPHKQQQITVNLLAVVMNSASQNGHVRTIAVALTAWYCVHSW